MKKIFLIIIACFICVSCGIKEKPEYRSEKIKIKLYI